MILTPQQEALAPVIADHLRKNDPRLLMIEGLSGVGKHEVVAYVVGELGKSSVDLDTFEFSSEQPTADVGLVEYRDPEQMSRVLGKCRDKVGAVVTLAHPRFQSATSVDRVCHKDALASVGIPTVVCALDPMNFAEERDFASLYGDKAPKQLDRLGLGLVGHLRALTETSDTPPSGGEVLSGARMERILRQASSHSLIPREQVEALLGKPLPFSLQFQLGWGDSLESQLAFMDCPVDLRLPRFEATLEQYRTIVGRESSRMDIFVPDLDEAVVRELGMDTEHPNSWTPSGHATRFCWGKAGGVTKKTLEAAQAGGPFQRFEFTNDGFEKWFRGQRQDLPLPTERFAYFATRSAYGSPRVDADMFPYAVETLLQARGVSYVADYYAYHSKRHQVGPSGVEVTALPSTY